MCHVRGPEEWLPREGAQRQPGLLVVVCFFTWLLTTWCIHCRNSTVCLGLSACLYIYFGKKLRLFSPLFLTHTLLSDLSVVFVCLSSTPLPWLIFIPEKERLSWDRVEANCFIILPVLILIFVPLHPQGILHPKPHKDSCSLCGKSLARVGSLVLLKCCMTFPDREEFVCVYLFEISCDDFCHIFSMFSILHWENIYEFVCPLNE